MAPTFNVAILIYPGADILDFTGPLEIYSCAPLPGLISSSSPTPATFKPTTFSHHNPVTAGMGNMTLIPAASLQEIDAKVEDYDILVIPGSMPDPIIKMLEEEDGKAILSLIKKFAALPPRKETGHRVIQSVCTGSLILAASGLLAGREVTTHHLFYDLCKEMADKAAGGESGTRVVRKRWVDAGFTEEGVRIVNAGGVSSGIDASLYVVEVVAGKGSADFVAEIAEFERREGSVGWGGSL